MSTKPIQRKQFQLSDQQLLSEYITGLTWSSAGTLAVITAAGELAIWQENNLNLLTSPVNYSLNCLGFSGEGKYLAVAGQKGEVHIWQVVENLDPELVTMIADETVWIDSLAWHPTARVLAFAVNRQIKIWDLDSQKIIITLDFADSSIFNLAWHPQGKLLAASGHGGVKVWQSDNWIKQPYRLQVPGASLDCAWSVDGQYLGSGNLDRTLTLLNWDHPPSWLMQGFPGKVSQVTWSPNQNQPLLAAACQEGITLWQYAQNQWQSHILQHEQTIKAIAFAPHSSILATAGDDNYLQLWQGKKLIQSLTEVANGYSCLAWHPRGKYLAAGGQNGELIIWQQSLAGKGFG
ncbi:MAG: WD40 repeat domain-containing protein [Cyanobacteria bacterium J06638_38]